MHDPVLPALLLGAGASRAAPSNRPLFADVRGVLARAIGVPLDQAKLVRMAPEVLLHHFRASGVPVDQMLKGILCGGEPNAIHYVAAQVLARGQAVWTTNFDDLVERAADAIETPYHVLSPSREKDVTCPCDLGHLVKPHGSIEDRRLALSSDEVLKPIGTRWRERLIRDFHRRSVAVVGYAGNDLDLRRALDLAFAGATEVCWYEVAGRRELIHRRFPEAHAAGVLSVSDGDRPCGNGRPDRAFWELWARRQGLTRDTPIDVVSALQLPPKTTPLKLEGFTPSRLLQARILDAFGQPREARRLFSRAAARGIGAERRQAIGEWFRTGLIHGAPWRPLMRPLFALLTEHGPLTHREQLWDWRLLLLTYSYRPAAAFRAGERSLRRVGPTGPRRVSVASAAKLIGEFDRARELASETKRWAVEESPNADLAAVATLNLSITLRWSGELEKAAREAEELAGPLGGLAGLNMMAWGATEQGALAALNGRMTEAESLLNRAASDFDDLQDLASLVDAKTMIIPVLQARGLESEARDEFAAARGLLRRLTLSQFRREALELIFADFARSDGRFDAAEKSYSVASRSPHLIHALLGLLGLGEVQRETGRSPQASSRALALARSRGVPYVALHALVTLGLSNPDRSADCELQIAALDYPAPVRDDGADGVLRFCLGPEPERHFDYFP